MRLLLLMICLAAMPLISCSQNGDDDSTAVSSTIVPTADLSDEALIERVVDAFLVPPPAELRWIDAANGQTPPEITPEGLEKGQKAYEQYCLACHGESGQGDGPLAAWMAVQPRNFAQATFKRKTTPESSIANDLDLFRSIAVGFPLHGMPSFTHLDAETRWGLVGVVKRFVKSSIAAELDELGLDADEIEEVLEYRLETEDPREFGAPKEATEALLARGKELFDTAECLKCHGPKAYGDGPSAPTLVDSWDVPIVPPDFRRGSAYMKAGAEAEDIVRTLMLGMPGTPMPSFELFLTEDGDPWAIAHHVRTLLEEGVDTHRTAWTTYLNDQMAAGKLERSVFDPPAAGANPNTAALPGSVDPAEAAASGCVACHTDVEPVAESKREALLALSGGMRGRGCVVCHEGNAAGATKRAAHAGLIVDPANDWILAMGRGCAKCHSGLAGGDLGDVPSPRSLPLMKVETPAGERSKTHG